MSESKRDRFDRLSESRKLRLIREIRLISNLSNRKNYDYDTSVVNELFNDLETALADAKRSFQANLPSD